MDVFLTLSGGGRVPISGKNGEKEGWLSKGATGKVAATLRKERLPKDVMPHAAIDYGKGRGVGGGNPRGGLR